MPSIYLISHFKHARSQLMDTIWGIDLGGTKIEGVVLRAGDAEGGSAPLCRIRVDTEASAGYRHIIDQFSNLIGLMAKEVGHRPKHIGIAHPGSIDPATQKMKNSNALCLNDQPFHRDLETALDLEVRMANDANCFALAEATFGAAKGAPTVFGVIMGTGVGGGVVIDGKVLNGCQGIGGEWGHNILIPDGPQCYCGKRGCVEQIISGPATESYYSSLTGKQLKMKEILALADAGQDKAARETIDRLVTYFGRAITYVINILDPHVVVLGGGLSNISRLYTDSLDEIRRNIFNTSLQTKIVQNNMGDSAGVFGATML